MLAVGRLAPGSQGQLKRGKGEGSAGEGRGTAFCSRGDGTFCKGSIYRLVKRKRHYTRRATNYTRISI